MSAAPYSRIMRIGIGLLLAAALVVLFLWGVDLHSVGLAFARADAGLLAGTFVITAGVYAVRSWRWGELLAPITRARQFDLFSATMVGFAASLVVPRSGELLRPWLIARRQGVPVSSALATVVLERLVDLMSVLTLFALYLFVLPRPAAEVDSRWIGALQAGGLAATGVLVVSLAVLVLFHARASAGARVLDGLLARAPNWVSQRAAGITRGFAGGLAVFRAPASHWAFIGLQSALAWGMTALSFHLVQLAFGIDLPPHTSLLLLAFVVVGESIPTPGMVGGFHAFYLLALTEVYGVDRATAAAAGIAAHALTNLPALLIGAALLPREGLNWRRATEAATLPDKARAPDPTGSESG